MSKTPEEIERFHSAIPQDDDGNGCFAMFMGSLVGLAIIVFFVALLVIFTHAV